MAPPGDYKYIA